MQGLNTTPLHGHSALIGVNGMLGIGLMLICLRALMPGRERVPGDTIFFLGAVALVVFVAGLKTGRSFRKAREFEIA